MQMISVCEASQQILHHGRVSTVAILSLFSLMGCASSNAENVRSATLFDQAVSICYSEGLSELMARGQTGVVEIDQASAPSVEALNAELRTYWMELVENPQRESGYVQGGVGTWKRLCDVELPENAVFHDIYKMDDAPRRGERKAPFYPRHPLSDTYSVDVARWIADGRLVHVEIAVGEKQVTGNLPD